MENWKELIVKRAEEAARSFLADSPACHDWDHTVRVRNNAIRIAQAEGADLLVVEVAALLHDIARPQELADRGTSDHAQVGADMALTLLPELGVTDNAFVTHVAHCIRTHRYRTRNPNICPKTIEAKIVFDADKLDSIGAIGIARSFHFAGRIGARVHNTDAEALSDSSYSREDSAYREYLVKLRFVKDKLLTSAGCQMALQRHEFMVTFFNQLNEEVK